MALLPAAEADVVERRRVAQETGRDGHAARMGTGLGEHSIPAERRE